MLACWAALRDQGLPSAKGAYLWDGAVLNPVDEEDPYLNQGAGAWPNINASGGTAYRHFEPTNQIPLRWVLSAFVNHTLADLTAHGDLLPSGLVVKEISIEPTINDSGDVAVVIYTVTPGLGEGYGVYIYRNGFPTRVIGQTDRAPNGGELYMFFGPLPRAWLANIGDVLFKALVSGEGYGINFGLFVLRANGVLEQIEMGGDPVPLGGTVHSEDGLGDGTLNGRGEVVFRVHLEDSIADSAIFLHSGGQLRTIMYQGQPSPLGGPFLSLYDPPDDNPGDGGGDTDPPLVNNRNQVVFKAEARTAGGKNGGVCFWSPRRRR